MSGDPSLHRDPDLCSCGRRHFNSFPEFMRRSAFGPDVDHTVEWEAAEVRHALAIHSFHIYVQCLQKSEADGIAALLTPEERERVSFTWRFGDR